MPDKHDSGEDTEHQTGQELVNTVACKGDARPEDHRNDGDERVADRGTEQGKRRCRKGGEGDVQRDLDPAREESGDEKAPW